MSAAILLWLVNPEMKISEKFDFVSDYLRKMSGGEFVGFNNSIFLSEKDTADRNYALAYYMKENKCFPKGTVLQDCLDFYFQVSLKPYPLFGTRKLTIGIFFRPVLWRSTATRWQ